MKKIIEKVMLLLGKFKISIINKNMIEIRGKNLIIKWLLKEYGMVMKLGGYKDNVVIEDDYLFLTKKQIKSLKENGYIYY